MQLTLMLPTRFIKVVLRNSLMLIPKINNCLWNKIKLHCMEIEESHAHCRRKEIKHSILTLLSKFTSNRIIQRVLFRRNDQLRKIRESSQERTTYYLLVVKYRIRTTPWLGRPVSRSKLVGNKEGFFFI